MSASGRGRVRGSLASTLLIAFILIAIAGLAVWASVCPCERVPGTYLFGEQIDGPVNDWTFANQVPLCQIEVQSMGLPHSINLNCMSADGDLYLSCASCDGKYWSTAVLEDPQARLRIGASVYPVTVTRVEDQQTLNLAWAARSAKTGRGSDQPRQDGWWSFRVVSR